MNGHLSPWRTEQGRAALRNWMTLLARGEGDIADFARDVVAGRAQPQDLLYSAYLDERTVASLHQAVDDWHALPADQQQAAITAAGETTEAQIAALAAAEVTEPARRPAPPADDPGDGIGPILRRW
ncbi:MULTISPECIES: hypothetical protein [Amycolatopsis]|uniref:hypothetical protein n=1 Tax=Amycolatopsis TaxID=1813 RepID=UPI000B8B024C|nr:MULTISPECIES: hypothetical protein [Amycolatopsis]OXM64601.1 hypothetical protein CF166_29530 [Amycolatopsis sp. KNN50.9b]